MFTNKKKEKVLDALLASPIVANVLGDIDRGRVEQRQEVLVKLAEVGTRHATEAKATADRLATLGPALEAARKKYLTLEQEAFLAVHGMFGASHCQQTEISRLERELTELAPQPLSDLLTGIAQALSIAQSKDVVHLGAMNRAAQALVFEPSEAHVLAEAGKLQGQLDEYQARLVRS